MAAAAIVVDGPFPNADRYSEWEEFPEWSVSTVDEEGEDIGAIQWVRDFNRAVRLGERLARDGGLELVVEATPAGRWW